MKVLQSGSIKSCENVKENFTVDLLGIILLSFDGSSCVVLFVRVPDRASLTGGHITTMISIKFEKPIKFHESFSLFYFSCFSYIIHFLTFLFTQALLNMQ